MEPRHEGEMSDAQRALDWNIAQAEASVTAEDYTSLSDHIEAVEQGLEGIADETEKTKVQDKIDAWKMLISSVSGEGDSNMNYLERHL
ncbi:MAG: hypothetical protein A2928_00965 [Candidatus Taylorbacteria bacterium RIFCSPLOWO2_01_FULL_45_15b]|uniref:Uncharacterized protein n=1 Tax=Candidatus Taylorbacteria bacterium RIFCSPLOWO2_01_FULL_45_15b TaxID=1802319 RepID=A0A1G2N7R7_9BACT|nr:MAG: hypothetical protein A2928_00965 [Candidatus Taylorbacteria bacterium RIFCSPLOWO2_01_FULL_45_15b]